jgi:DNA-directed RNA polymerase specialized sigma24 family protein
VVEIVGVKVNFDAFSRRCSRRDRRLLELKAEGWSQVEIADRLGVSAPAVCQRLVKLRHEWETKATA